MEFSLLTFQITVLGLLLVACLSAIALRKLHFPYTIGLMIIGIGFASEKVEAELKAATTRTTALIPCSVV